MDKPNNILEREVRDELSWDSYTDDSRIDVKADAGTIYLSGVVYSYPELLNAEDDAWSVHGVKKVDDAIRVGPLAESIADDIVAANAQLAIDNDRRVPKGAVQVSVLDGWETLSGRVRHQFERLAAKFDASHVHGVLGVNDNVAIDSAPIPTDVSSRITTALGRSSLLNGASISVSNNGGTVFLDGTIGSHTAAERAEAVAWNAPGVAEVVDRLEIMY
ncbi:MAG: ornithine aminotransferase [Acidimicrobiaceae bacterium]|nr:ornithine aminotransferase [Acidimicrobiaceae bacterium]